MKKDTFSCTLYDLAQDFSLKSRKPHCLTNAGLRKVFPQPFQHVFSNAPNKKSSQIKADGETKPSKNKLEEGVRK